MISPFHRPLLSRGLLIETALIDRLVRISNFKPDPDAVDSGVRLEI
jgi:hypothetical protein